MSVTPVQTRRLLGLQPLPNRFQTAPVLAAPEFQNAQLGPRFLPTAPVASKRSAAQLRAWSASEDLALSSRLRKRLNKKRGDDISTEDAQYLVNALRRAPAIGETTVRLLLSMLEHANLEDPSLWSDMFVAVAKKAPDLDTLLPPERIVTVIHELAEKLGKHKKLNDEAVEKLLAFGTLRGVPNIRTRRALEAVRRLHPMTQSAAKTMKTRLDAIPFAPPKPWTFFIYMASENNLEPYAVDDLVDMQQTFEKIAPFANVVVLADGGVVNDEDKTLGPQPANNWSQKTRLLLIEPSEMEGHVMSRAIPVPVDTPLGELMQQNKGDLNLGSPDTLRKSIDFVQKGIPSDHMFFSVWSHGLAWKGIAEDENAGRGSDMLRPHELIDALGDLEHPPAVMGFDACLMANSGVSALLEELGSEYMIGSQELLDAEGWGYHRVFEGLAKAEKKAGKLTPEALAHTIVDVAHGTTLSAMKLSESTKVWAGLDKLGEALNAIGGRSNPEVQQILESLPRYGSYGVDASEEDKAQGDEDVVDVIHMCKQLEAAFPRSDIAKAAKKLRETTADATHFKNMPSKSYPGIENYSHGLTTYLPRTGDVFKSHYLGKGAVWKHRAPSWIALLKQKPEKS
ncbi:MAG: clostripain-related cysteine peptidase [Deltaproteobacteria bacterium]|jgi:hypothetical protein